MGKVTLFLLCCFVAFLPFEMVAYFGELPSGGKLVGMLVVGSAVLAFLTGHRVRGLSRPMVLRVVLVLFSAMSVAWSVDRDVTLENLPRVALLLIFVLVVWEFAVTYKDQVWLLRSLLVGLPVPLLAAFLQFRGTSRFAIESGARFSGGIQDANYLAYMYSVAILIAVYLATNSLPLDRYCRWLYYGLAVLCAMGTLLTGSRGGFVSMVIASVFAMVLAGVSRRRIITVLQVLAVVVFVFVLARYIVPTVLLDRVTAGQSLGEDPRVRIWGRGLAAIGRNPLLGVGAGAFANATTVSGEKINVAHNTFVSVLVELGAVGLVLYLSYIILLFRAAWRAAAAGKAALDGDHGRVVLERQFGWFADGQIELVLARHGPGAGSGLPPAPPRPGTFPLSQWRHARRPRTNAAAVGKNVNREIHFLRMVQRRSHPCDVERRADRIAPGEELHLRCRGPTAHRGRRAALLERCRAAWQRATGSWRGRKWKPSGPPAIQASSPCFKSRLAAMP